MSLRVTTLYETYAFMPSASFFGSETATVMRWPTGDAASSSFGAGGGSARHREDSSGSARGNVTAAARLVC